jgi:putative transposase
LSVEKRKSWIDPSDGVLSLARQCAILDVARSSWYYRPVAASGEDLVLLNLIDEEYTKRPFYGSRKILVTLQVMGYVINRKRVQRLMRILGVSGIVPGPNTSKRNQAHKVYPYLLTGLEIVRPNQVWSTDITYIRLAHGFVYLVAVIDWFSRYVVAWRLSNSLDTSFCLEALEEALRHGMPDIFNTDQGVQFTSDEFTGCLKEHQIKISMDSKGRALDNIFVERLWRSVKYEDIYIKGYGTMKEAYEGLKQYFQFYNNERYHQSLDYKTPWEVHYGAQSEANKKCA